jgi:sigma-B regulation protein RsbU (phosphoserine phosphatase)
MESGRIKDQMMTPAIKHNAPSILIVDDNVKNLQVLGGFLQLEGLMVEFALDGISALKWLEKKKFDLILLDIMMPGMDGYEVCSIIKKNPDISEIPVIFITAKTDSESIVKGFETGAVDYISKPFIQSELLVRVKTQLTISSSKERILIYLNEIQERNRNISDSIDYARYIQTAVLNTSEKYLKFLPEHFILYLPKDILSGDFYWVSQVENKIIIAVMDCTGHGVPGALMSIMGITLLNEIVLHENTIQPDKILESLRVKILETLGQKIGNEYSIKDGIEGLVICFDLGSNKLRYSGSFNPLVLIHDDQIINIKADNIPIGYYESLGKFSLHEIDIEKNDTIYMFSDGIIDQFGGPVNRRFMIKQLKEIFFANHKKGMFQQKEILMNEIALWKGDLVQTDDIMVMGIRF